MWDDTRRKVLGTARVLFSLSITTQKKNATISTNSLYHTGRWKKVANQVDLFNDARKRIVSASGLFYHVKELVKTRKSKAYETDEIKNSRRIHRSSWLIIDCRDIDRRGESKQVNKSRNVIRPEWEYTKNIIKTCDTVF